MTHFGLACPPFAGHLHPALALGRELAGRGHRVTLLQIEDVRPAVEAAGLGFHPLGRGRFPAGTLARVQDGLGRVAGAAALYGTMAQLQLLTLSLLEDGPAAVGAAGIEALLVDQAELGGGTVAERAGVPFMSLASALLMNVEASVPPLFTSWEYEPSWWGQARNLAAYASVWNPCLNTVDAYRWLWGLERHRGLNEHFSTLVQLSQQPPELEFPRAELPAEVHFTGPFFASGGAAGERPPVDFPFEALDGRPLVYASMGTAQNRVPGVFQTIAEACAGLGVQLVISLGGGLSPAELPPLAGAPLVVRYAPQLALLERASLAITHGGLNTTLEALRYGVPQVALPMANDQPGVAARLRWCGAGDFVEPLELGAPRLRAAIQRVLERASYRHHARRVRKSIEQCGGAAAAADRIERCLARAQ